MDKVVDSLADAVGEVPVGASIAVGGFAGAGFPAELMMALADTAARELHIITNGVGGEGVDRLLADDRVRKYSAGFPFRWAWRDPVYAGKIEIEVIPQGTFTERLRAGSAGICAFYTPTSVGSVLAKGGFPKRFDRDGNPIEFADPKEVRQFNGREYVLEHAIRPDFGLVRAYKADRAGNLVFRGSARNFNPIIAMASRRTVVQADEIVEMGGLTPEEIHVPGMFVDAVVHVPRVTRSGTPQVQNVSRATVGWTREEMALRVGRDVGAGWCVNLGAGMPSLVAKHIPLGKDVMTHMENGVIGSIGSSEDFDQDLTDVVGKSVSIRPGGAIVDSVLSFAIARSGYLDLTVLGGLQVSGSGDLANWFILGSDIGVGGAMDLIQGAKRVWVMMEHTDRNGNPKIVNECEFALTGPRVVSRVYTNLGVFSLDRGSVELIEYPDTVEIDYIRAHTGVAFAIRPESRSS